MTEGFGLTIPPDVTYPNQVAALIGGGFAATNIGVGGQTCLQMASDAASQINPLFAPHLQKTLVVCWGGTNDLYFGASAAITYQRIVDYCRILRPVGWRIIVLSILPRSNVGTPAGFETSRQSVNNSLLADFSSSTIYTNVYAGAPYADYLVHVGGDSTIGDSGDENNTTYYLDKVHLTSAGYAIVADYVRNAIQLF